MEIVAFDTDDRADGDTTINNGKAKITWISKDLLPTVQKLHNTAPAGAFSYAGTNVRTYLRDVVEPLIPEIVRNNIVTVTKTMSTYSGSSVSQTSMQLATWIPSSREVQNSTVKENSGAIYSKFTDNASRVKKKNGNNSEWALRSVLSKGYYLRINSSGGNNNISVTSIANIALGFCT